MRMRRIRASASLACPASSATIEPIIQLWVLRILVALGGQRMFVSAHGVYEDGLAELLGLGDLLEPSVGEFDPGAVRAQLSQLHRQAEKTQAKATLPTQLRDNVRDLAGLVGLDAIDCRILEFAVLIHSERVLDDTADYLGSLSSAKACRALAVILGLSEAAVRAAFGAQGILAHSGLVTLARNGSGSLRSKLDLISGDFADLMASVSADPVNLLRGIVAVPGPAQLSLADYDHIRASLDILRPYLRHATATNQRGVNIFLHGVPGTGKSQLARVLAADLGCNLFEVASEDSEGDPIGGERRLRASHAAQSFFARQNALIVFDEVDDVFNDGDSFFGRKSTAQLRKAWTNRLLEENPVPTLWLSNTGCDIDPAFIRRFDMVFELPVPPRLQRERILQQACGDLLDGAGIARIAETESLAPAVVVRAGAVVRTIRAQLGEAGSTTAFEHLISNTLQAQGHRPLLRHDPTRLPEVYDPGFIHADADLAQVAAGLSTARAGRLCLHGPSGTGKSAYGRWLADRLGVSLLVKRASDLISPWVGASEQNIARAFRQATQDNALLLIDEVDSFLQDRRRAKHGWEASLVNEMLTQIEAFPGVFIASTNLMHGLDQAALRRFDLTVKFDFLRPDQAWELLRRHAASLGFGPVPDSLKIRLAQLAQLTPGDFASVLRQHRFRPLESATALVAALESVCAAKEGARRPIGFH